MTFRLGSDPEGVSPTTAAECRKIVHMKGASKPKKGQKKQAQKTLKEKRSEKRAAAKKGFGTS